MRRSIDLALLDSYRDHSFTLSRRRIRTLGFSERMAIELRRIKVHPLTWRTYTEVLTKWQGHPRTQENSRQRRTRQRFYNSISR